MAANTTLSANTRQANLHFQAAGYRSDGQVIARSAAMREILGLVRRIAATDVPVLIHGEIGVGKQTIAREIHRQSRRAAKPFVHTLCGSLRESDLGGAAVWRKAAISLGEAPARWRRAGAAHSSLTGWRHSHSGPRSSS